VRLVFHYLQNNLIQVTTRDAQQLDEAQKVVQEAAADIRAGEFPRTRVFVCRNCAYKPICRHMKKHLALSTIRMNPAVSLIFKKTTEACSINRASLVRRSALC